MIKTIGRLKFLAQKLHFILENAFMPCDLWFCRHLRRPFLSILNHTAPALILEGPGSRSKPANLFRSVKSLDMSES